MSFGKISSVCLITAFLLGGLSHVAAADSDVAKVYKSAQKVKPLAVGHTVPEATVTKLDGQHAKLSEVLADKPTVLVFFRGGWCPFCTRHLAAMRKVVPELRDLGYQVVAISPDSAKGMREAAEKFDLDYTLLSDEKAEAAKRFGLAFRLDPETVEKYKGFGIKLRDIPGVEGKVLPVPAVYLIDADGEITFSHFDANYKNRIEPSEVLKAAK